MRTQQPPPRNPCRVSHVIGLASSAFARHYSQNHHCFLFLQVLRCFTSPRSLQLAYTFNQRSHTKPKQCMRGFPIRTSWPHRLVINSTRLIADSHVLHRLLLPRHPPCALTNFPNQQPHKRPYKPTQPTTPQNRTISRISHKLSKYNNQTKDGCHHTDTIITRQTHQPTTGQHVELSIRCSRPLYSYHNNTPPTPTTTQ